MTDNELKSALAQIKQQLSNQEQTLLDLAALGTSLKADAATLEQRLSALEKSTVKVA